MNDVRAHSPDAVAALAAAFSLDDLQAAAVSRYVDFILTWRQGNVTGLTGRGDVVTTLLGDSLALLDAPLLRAREGREWLDLGAGAGVPGLPLAIALSAARVTLLEAAAKKCAFLAAAIAVVGLGERVRVVHARSECFAAAGAPGREAFAVVLARAVAPLPSLVELAAPLLACDGVLLASKTRRALTTEGPAAEIAAGECGLALEPPVRLPRSPLVDAVAVVFRKVAATPDRLPRREGMAVKRPLAR